MFPSICFSQTFSYPWLFSFTATCRPGLSWISFHQGHKEITQLKCSKQGDCFTAGVLHLLSCLACLHLSSWFYLAFCLFFNLSFSSRSVSTDLPLANHPHQLLATCHVLFSSIYVLLTSVGSKPWYIAVLLPKIFVVCDDLKQSHHPTQFPDLQPPWHWLVEWKQKQAMPWSQIPSSSLHFPISS